MLCRNLSSHTPWGLHAEGRHWTCLPPTQQVLSAGSPRSQLSSLMPRPPPTSMDCGSGFSICLNILILNRQFWRQPECDHEAWLVYLPRRYLLVPDPLAPYWSPCGSRTHLLLTPPGFQLQAASKSRPQAAHRPRTCLYPAKTCPLPAVQSCQLPKGRAPYIAQGEVWTDGRWSVMGTAGPCLRVRKYPILDDLLKEVTVVVTFKSKPVDWRKETKGKNMPGL